MNPEQDPPSLVIRIPHAPRIDWRRTRVHINQNSKILEILNNSHNNAFQAILNNVKITTTNN